MDPIRSDRPTPANEMPVSKEDASKAQASRVARDRSLRRKVVEELGGGSPGNPDHMADTMRRAQKAQEERMRRFREGR